MQFVIPGEDRQCGLLLHALPRAGLEGRRGLTVIKSQHLCRNVTRLKPAEGQPARLPEKLINVFCMSTQLTAAGWEGPLANGTWSWKADVVIDLEGGITVDTNVSADTKSGDDKIEGNSSSSTSGSGILNQGQLSTAKGNDSILGSSTGFYGIHNFAEGGSHVSIATGNGNDQIYGTSIRSGMGAFGLYNEALMGSMASIDTGKGHDTVTGEADNYGIRNIAFINSISILATGNGHDVILGKGFYGIDNYSNNNSRTQILTGAGNDLVEGVGSRGIGSYGIYNYANGNSQLSIETEQGSDRVHGDGVHFGIYSSAQLSSDVTIHTGLGADSIIGTGMDPGSVGIFSFAGDQSRVSILTGDGNDHIQGIGMSRGISLEGTETGKSLVDSGSGHDYILGVAASTFTGEGAGSDIAGIFIGPSSVIDSGIGHDTVNALQGGFINHGLVSLGAGNDSLIGFNKRGDGVFQGDSGNDRILLDVGTYNVEVSGDYMLIDGSMKTSGFELIGSALSGNTTAFIAGTLMISDTGCVTYL
jgi:hypothetical protein